jgi:hypothetical protein
MFILGQYWASKSFVAVREALSHAYPDKDVKHETKIHRVTAKFLDKEVFALGNICGAE